MHTGGVILCGGKSTRMGVPKATLPFGDELMLQRVVRLLAEAVQPIVVVAAAGQELPRLPADVVVARDHRPDRGPLEGMHAGLQMIEADAAYVTSCDVPLLSPAFVRRMVELLEDYDIAVPTDGEHYHPLSAVYRTSILPHITSLLSGDHLRVAQLFQQCSAREVPVDKLRDIDPSLHSLMNCNCAAEYAAALAAAGLRTPSDLKIV